jgi:hypothetical protein
MAVPDPHITDAPGLANVAESPGLMRNSEAASFRVNFSSLIVSLKREATDQDEKSPNNFNGTIANARERGTTRRLRRPRSSDLL